MQEGGAMIVDAFVSRLLDGLDALVKGEVAMLLDATHDIAQLQTTLQEINPVLADAERKRIRGEAVDDRLKKLTDVMYDTDDILDECRIEAEKSKATASGGPQPSSSSSFRMSVRCHFCHFSCSCFGKTAFAHRIGRKIQGLNRRLKDICAEISSFNLQRSSTGDDYHRPFFTISMKTSSIPEPDVERSNNTESNIEKDTRKLVESLIKEDTRENILTYAIIGIGGIGKTTLAQKIYNDERVTANFSMKLWVCVSQDFIESRLLKEIITHAGGDPGGASSRSQLEPMVRNTVKNKKFLLILDDLWDARVWNDLLRHSLQSGATGSRVLVTTRNKGVASQMRAVESHEVQPLSAEEGWELLCKTVVLSGKEREIEDLKNIGVKIVDNCRGLPLAIKVIGAVLRGRSVTKKDWEMVLEILSKDAGTGLPEVDQPVEELEKLSNDAWTGLPEVDQPVEVLEKLSNDAWVQPVLSLSYEDLPSHLKQCFLYCSLFPKDYKFNRRELIHFWISEGFIHEEGHLTLEELGEDYYGDLVQRCFLEPHPTFPGCTVRDLLLSLAQLIAQDENLDMKNGVEVINSSFSVRPRRLRGHVIEEKCQEFIDALEGHNSLRTLLLSLDGSKVNENVFNNLIKKTPRLRVLRFSWSRIIKLPDSLGNLIHLRYLDVSWSEISKLPESIGNLVNLQFLILQFCEFLRSLPKSIGKLHNLRCLDLFGTELEGIPIEIANLHLLNELIGFVVRNNNSNSGWCTLEELKFLQNLKVLHIKHLARALNEVELGQGNALQDMSQLEELRLFCSPSGHHDDDEEIIRIEKIFEKMLCPTSGLEFLIIKDFFGRKYPSWICNMNSIARLHLAGCHMCPQLPQLGKLPNLDYLYIGHADAVKKIGTEFLGQEPNCSRDGGGIHADAVKEIGTEFLGQEPNCSRDGGGIHADAVKEIGTEVLGQEPDCSRDLFPKLTKLIFESMKIWEEWEWEVKDDDRLIALPNLKELTLDRCPKLRSLPSGLAHHATTLTKLQMRDCGSLEAIRGFSSINELEISGCASLKEIRGLSSVKELEISYSPNLKHLLDLPSLKTLTLRDPEMRCLPQWFHDGGKPVFHVLNKLQITASNELLPRCLKDGLDWLKIEHIPYVYARNSDGSRYVSKTPSEFKNNLYVYD